jgi:hypothetical protein
VPVPDRTSAGTLLIEPGPCQPQTSTVYSTHKGVRQRVLISWPIKPVQLLLPHASISVAYIVPWGGPCLHAVARACSGRPFRWSQVGGVAVEVWTASGMACGPSRRVACLSVILGQGSGSA